MDSFITFQLMYIILEGLNEEKPSDNVIAFLTDANPFMREGENSVDVVVYNDFKKKYYEVDEHSDYSYDFVCNYLKNIEYYKGIYELFMTLSREEYIDNCNDILNDKQFALKPSESN